MKVKTMIEKLQGMNPEAEVKLHRYDGNNALFVLAVTNRHELKNIVFIEDKSDNDMTEEINAQFEHAAETLMDELDFFTNLLEIGITIEDIKEFAPKKYEYSKKFMEEHGLV